MKNALLFFITFGIAVVWSVQALGQESQEQPDAFDRLQKKIEVLEEEMRQLKESAEAELAREAVQDKKIRSAYTYWKDDFYITTEDKKFWMKIRGNLHFDTKFYSNRTGLPNTFDIRRARIDFQGMWYDYIAFRVQTELADSPYIRNAWADFKFRDWLHLRAGQMKPPFSTSWWTTDNNVTFLERGASTPLYLYFDRGWWLWGNVLNNTLTWNLSAFNGTGMDFDEKKGDIDDHKDFVARLFCNPFRNHEGSVLERLNLCVEGSLGKQSVPTKRFEKRGYGAAIRDFKFWTWETEDPGTGRIDSRNRYGVEVQYILGSFNLSSEYLVVLYDDIDIYALDGTKVVSQDGTVLSWSTWVSYFLTGEQKRVGNFGWKQPKPLSDFDLFHLEGIGAWELLARYTYTRTSESLFDTTTYAGNDYTILNGASRVNEYSVGVSWTWNPMLRWQLNYVHLHGNGMATGPTDDADMVGLRMIFKF